MKKYMYFIFLMSLFACTEDDLVWYQQEKDALQFYVDADNGISIERTFNFAEATYVHNENGVDQVRYYGDSLFSMRYAGKNGLILELQGFPTPDERPYRLKTVLLEGQDSSKVAEVVFDSYYSLSPNQLRDTIALTVLRPKTRGTYRVGITIDTSGSDAFFSEGVAERAVLELEIKDTYEEPEAWQYRTEWLGEFDEEKYAFMVTYSQLPFSRYNDYMWNQTDKYNLELRQALAAFNATAAPEDRKAFSFPETTKPTWWDTQLELLGDFSEEKHAFLKNIVGGELTPSSRLEHWNLIFRQACERQGITSFEIPRKETMSSWWRTSVLGEWSIEKQEFVILNLFPLSGYSITETTWTYANVLLRQKLEEYNAANPKLDFEFPIEECPDWWSVRAGVLGEYSPEKRDLAVSVVFEANRKKGEYNITALMDPNYSNFDSDYLGMIKAAAQAYNQEHPDNPIVLPVVVPSWWSNNTAYLGEYSEEKESFMKQVISSLGGYYGEGLVWADWNLLFRYELAAYNEANKDKPYTFTFPEIDSKPSYWSNHAWLGEYSDSKKVFVWMIIIPNSYGSMPDDWFLGGGWYSITEIQGWLTNVYDNGGYEAFMQRYAGMNPAAFSFSW